MNDGEAALELYRNRNMSRDELETWIFELLTEPGYDEGFKAGKEEQEEGYDEGYKAGRADLVRECGADDERDLKALARRPLPAVVPPPPKPKKKAKVRT